ncbi:hypothetical protein STEG23_037376 [Scotinomys teguina]
MAAAAVPYITWQRQSTITRTSCAAARRHHGAAAHSSALQACTEESKDGGQEGERRREGTCQRERGHSSESLCVSKKFAKFFRVQEYQGMEEHRKENELRCKIIITSGRHDIKGHPDISDKKSLTQDV